MFMCMKRNESHVSATISEAMSRVSLVCPCHPNPHRSISSFHQKALYPERRTWKECFRAPLSSFFQVSITNEEHQKEIIKRENTECGIFFWQPFCKVVFEMNWWLDPNLKLLSESLLYSTHPLYLDSYVQSIPLLCLDNIDSTTFFFKLNSP